MALSVKSIYKMQDEVTQDILEMQKGTVQFNQTVSKQLKKSFNAFKN